ncbi:MAG: KH domain-containing protein [Myxococcales bacterium]|nr:KH domain-containing protein [Myxococcales bacterium]
MSHQANGTRDEEVLAFVVTSLVDNPASVRVSSQGSGPERTLTVTVADSDRGLIVGRQGRTIRAIETIVAASVDGPPPVIEVTSAE